MAKKRLQIVKVKDYEDGWVNRLAVVLDQFRKMDSTRERGASLRFLIEKYQADLPDADPYGR